MAFESGVVPKDWRYATKAGLNVTVIEALLSVAGKNVCRDISKQSPQRSYFHNNGDG